MNDTTKKARELLASEYEKDSPDSALAQSIREGKVTYWSDEVAIRAILAALSEKERAGQVPVARVSGMNEFGELICTPLSDPELIIEEFLYTAPAAGAVPEGYVLVQRRDAESVARFASNHAGKGLRSDTTLAGMRILDQLRLAASKGDEA